MKRRTILTLLPALVAPRFALAQPSRPVVATFSILADMVRVVGGDDVPVTSLVPPDGDPHVWEPRPADLHALAVASVLVENGLGLEGWMSRLAQASGFQGVRVVAAESVAALTMTESARRITDPHAWQNPQNGILYVRAIAAGLTRAMPQQAAAIATRSEAYIAQIAAMDAWISDQYAAIPQAQRRILTSHDAFGYYGARYGIELLAVQGISTDGEPSAAAIAALIGQIKQHNIRAVFVENMTNPKFATVIAHDTGAKLGATIYSDALSADDGPAPTYLRMLRHNTEQFVTAMRAP